MMARPVAVDPVKATLSTSMWCAMALPTVLPYPETRLTVPGGKPAREINSQIFSADKGVASADLITTVFPVTRAGAIFQINIIMGKLDVVS